MEAPLLRNDVSAVLRTVDTPLDTLVELLYDELREMARRQLAREAAGHTLQPTALLHEAYSGWATRHRSRCTSAHTSLRPPYVPCARF
jgi:hypothetical protein